jgi:phosphohistidine phosphatase
VRYLWLLRHAKSDWDEAALDDQDRPLAKRGRKAAPRVGRWMREQGLAFDLVVCSSALRARQTAELVDPPLAPGGRLDVEPDVYAAGADALLAFLRALPPDAQTVLLVGHNPGIQELAELLAGAGDAQLRGRLRERFPTGAVAGLAVEGDWAHLGPGDAELVSYAVPRDLP